MTLSGGTTGLSLSISDSSRFGAMTWEFSDKLGFMIRACGDRAKKYVECGYKVIAWRRDGTSAQLRGEPASSYSLATGKKVV